jgi:FkbM family methyltransferase
MKKRYKIIQTTDSQLNLVIRLFWILFNWHFFLGGFGWSNYGVWLADRKDDATFNFCMDASYSNHLESLLLREEDPIIFIDIGANVGIFSLIAAKNSRIKAIHSFEPDPESFHYMSLNVYRNSAKNMTIHNFAIGQRFGEILLTRTPGHSGVSKIVSKEDPRADSSIKIKMVNHEYFNLLFTGDDDYFIKIDVEGYEFDVLKTISRASFFPSVTKLFIEFDVRRRDLSEIEIFLNASGFREYGRWGSELHWDALWCKSSLTNSLPQNNQAN